MKIQMSVTNLVATGHLGQRVDLRRIASLEYACFDLDVYHCAYIHAPWMHSKVCVFHTGKMISMGTKSEDEARHDLMQVVEYLAKEGVINAVVPLMKVQNIVLTGGFGRDMDIISLQKEVGASMYEPEQFPGVIHYPPRNPGISILFFQSGKFVVAGVRRHKQIPEIRKYLEAIGRRFSK